MECPRSQRGLSEPECLLKDDGTSTTCSKYIRSSDLTGQSISGYNFVSLSIDLNSIIQNLNIYNEIGNLKVGAFRFHFEITQLEIYHRSTFIRSELFDWLPNLRHLHLSKIKFRYFIPFSHYNPSLTYLHIHDAAFTLPDSYSSVLRKIKHSQVSLLSLFLI